MSLLLDALKKAADDKQKISRGESTDTKADLRKVKSVNLSVRDDVLALTKELNLQPKEHDESTSEILSLNENADVAELTLDIDQNLSYASTSTDIEDNGISGIDAGKEHPEELNMDINVNDHGSAKNPEKTKIRISDDALLMLVDKTNRDVKQEKTTFVIGLLITSLIILISGGVYYYLDTSTEIAAIERKHQIAMRSMQSKTSQVNLPANREIIRNLVGDAELKEKVQLAKQHIASKKNSAKNNSEHTQSKSTVKSKVSSTITEAAASEISIKKSSKTDPLSEKLNAAWLAYESGNYNEAKKLYRDALKVESGSRDALLGLGAIAVREKDSMAARNSYSLVLKQDPNDPIATAALAGLYSEESSPESSEEYLLSMLRRNPEAPQLNFSLANIYAQQNKWKSAQQYYFNAWKYDIDNADYIFNLAVSMDQLGKRQQAIKFYKDSLVKSANKQVSFSRGIVEKRIMELSEL
ncbi:MAG: tetratricopeptide repeat protein [Gammaproteobacteria bacterium]|nr:tetratricopeptide repeat protein [Gammaproteobacteria bacterium]